MTYRVVHIKFQYQSKSKWLWRIKSLLKYKLLQSYFNYQLHENINNNLWIENKHLPSWNRGFNVVKSPFQGFWTEGLSSTISRVQERMCLKGYVCFCSLYHLSKPGHSQKVTNCLLYDHQGWQEKVHCLTHWRQVNYLPCCWANLSVIKYLVTMAMHPLCTILVLRHCHFP